jgi:hypothetical protein
VLARLELRPTAPLDEPRNCGSARSHSSFSLVGKSFSTGTVFSTTAPFDLCGAHNDGRPLGREEPLPAASPLDDLRKYRCGLLDAESRLPEIVETGSEVGA